MVEILRVFGGIVVKKLAIVAAVAGLIGTSAFAADLNKPVYKAPPTPPAPVFSWTGFYVGGNAGWGWGNANDSLTLGPAWLDPVLGAGDNFVIAPLGNHQLRPNGFTGGIEAGYNYQTGPWVLGIEADLEAFGLKRSLSTTVLNPGSGDSYAFGSSFNSNWLATVRPRAGYAFDRWLVYVTGGLAVAHQGFSQSIVQLNVPFAEAGSVSKTTAGWTVGVGTEYAFDNHWTVKGEYLFVDPGSVSFSSVGTCPASPTVCAGFLSATAPLFTAAHSAHLKADILRAGINYKL